MSKNILIISTSLRKNSNSGALAQAFANGAKNAGNNVEIISLENKKIAFCRGCFACQKTGRCVIKDDASEITEKMAQADVIVWATPIYYFEMSGQMKTMIDRANALYVRNYAFRDVYFLSSAAGEEENCDERAVHGVEGWIACFENTRLAGKVFAGGVTDIGDIKEHKALEDAYEMGARIS